MILMETFFWAGLGILIYTYLGYPLVLYLVSRLYSPVKKFEGPERLPSVTLVVAAYNEARVIAGKIGNCLSLDYPPELLDFVIASDGSADATNKIVAEWAGKNPRVRLLSLPRGGKAAAINAAMTFVKSEIVVFSDANTIYAKDAIRRLVSHFSDSSTGCVCGRLSYTNPGQVVSGKGESAYWKYETALKKMESRLGYVAGANGAIYAIRSELFMPLPPRTINDDFMISMRIVQRGFRCLYDGEAIAFEEVAPNIGSEFRRHIRDGAGHYIAVSRLLPLLNPLLGIRSFIYWSHRIFRWTAPVLLPCLVALNLFLSGRQPYHMLLVLQLLFYSLAIVGYSVSGVGKVPFILYVPFYFSNLNLALLLGLCKAVTGMARPAWESTQRG